MGTKVILTSFAVDISNNICIRNATDKYLTIAKNSKIARSAFPGTELLRKET